MTSGRRQIGLGMELPVEHRRAPTLLNLLTQADSGITVSPDHRILAPAPKDADADLLLGAAARLLRDLGA